MNFSKTLRIFSALSILFGFGTAHSATCPTITCPADIVVRNACPGEVVSYTHPVGEDPCPLTVSQEFNYTGAIQNWMVPADVYTIRIEASGAQGGSGDAGNYTGGLGAEVAGEFSVTPGETLNIVVGGAGQNGISSVAGGGGGGSFAYRGSIGDTGLLIAAGGGGAGGEEATTDGCSARVDGYSSSLPPTCSQNLNNGQGGLGGGSNGGGGGAGWLADGQDYSGKTDSGGDRFSGGVGQFSTGGFGGGGGSHDGGAGGGGYTGGPGGDNNVSGGGSGGSFNGGTNPSISVGRTGDGIVTIYYNETSVVTTTQIAGLGSGSSFPLGTTTETYEVNNASSGDSNTCSFNITVSTNSQMFPIITKDGKATFLISNQCD